MKKTKKLLSLIVACIFIFSFNITTFASNSNTPIGTVSNDGLSIYIDLEELGNGYLHPDGEGKFSGELKSSGGATTVSCDMVGYVDDIKNKYNIIIKWKGDNQVNFIKAKELNVLPTSYFNTKPYWSNPISFSAGSTKSGSYTVGSVIIPPDIDKVKVTTSGLQCYFNDRDFWIRINEMNGAIDL